MAVVYMRTSMVGPLAPITINNGDDVVITAGVLIGQEEPGEDLINASGSGHDFLIFGTLSGTLVAIDLGSSSLALASNTVLMMPSGVVYGTNCAINFQGGGNTVLNDGLISSDGAAIIFEGGSNPASLSTVTNRGLISGLTGILSSEAIVVTNLGTIESFDTGAGSAIEGSGLGDSIVNRGTLIGDILLGAGNDLFDNRGGSLEFGAVAAGEGNDTFFAGAEAEIFDGGAGVDTLDFRGSGGLRVSLEDDSGTGLAEGDIYIGIETVFGSRGSADTLIGNASNNNLSGFGGNDVLSGGGGRDILEGGIGSDTLAGGSGQDLFRYRNVGEGGDTITDFNAADDGFRISAGGFGGGLVADRTLAASQFQTRADNLAQDANDRFIFRTTDQTLWFDVNGSAAGGLSLIADLQNSAAVTNLDILLV